MSSVVERNMVVPQQDSGDDIVAEIFSVLQLYLVKLIEDHEIFAKLCFLFFSLFFLSFVNLYHFD